VRLSIKEHLERNKNAFSCLGVAGGWSLLAIFCICLFPSVFQNTDRRIFDRKISLKPAPDHPKEIVHLDIDDAAVREFGQWPWDRRHSARIVEKLSEIGAKVVVFDILYSSSGKSEEGDRSFFDAIEKAGNVVSATGLGISPRSSEKKLELDADRSRAEALYNRSWNVKVPGSIALFKVTNLKNSLLPLPEIIKRSKELGHIKGTADPDGVHRTVPLLVSVEDLCVPSLSLAAVMTYWDLNPVSVSLDDKGLLHINHSGRVVAVPISSEGIMRVNWGKPWESFKHYSALDVLIDTSDPSLAARYKNKIVVVGVTVSGATDFGATPVGINVPLSRLHSNAIATMLTGAFISEIRFFPYIAGLGAILAMLVSLFVSKFRLAWSILIVASTSLLFACVSTASLIMWLYEIPMSGFFFIFLPGSLGAVALRTIFAELEAARISRALNCYLSPQIREAILKRSTEIDLSTKRKELTIVFVDIEGFSTISETVEMEYLNEFLNDFFKMATEAIFRHGGTIDKFLGDGLLAFFGDPLPLEGHALAAVSAAIDTQKGMEQLSRRWSNFGLKEFEKGIKIRIGISTGIVVVGNLGTSGLMEYTVLGSTVNIANRLQAKARPGGILMTSRTWALVKDQIPASKQETVTLKGIDREIDVYHLETPMT
jgi:adenylate cyclase